MSRHGDRTAPLVARPPAKSRARGSCVWGFTPVSRSGAAPWRDFTPAGQAPCELTLSMGNGSNASRRIRSVHKCPESTPFEAARAADAGLTASCDSPSKC